MSLSNDDEMIRCVTRIYVSHLLDGAIDWTLRVLQH